MPDEQKERLLAALTFDDHLGASGLLAGMFVKGADDALTHKFVSSGAHCTSWLQTSLIQT